MSPETLQFYDFADFRLDRSQKILLRNGKPIPLTPKVFDTLEVLVENRGKLLKKDELLQTLWQDRFVEESNLTSNIKMLRKALGDDAARPQFIETVQRRGYRFIAAVRESVSENESTDISSIPAGPKTVTSAGFRKIFAAALAILVIGVIGSGLWYAGSRNFDSAALILSADFSSEKLSADGKVRSAAISPDGKNVVYTNRAGGEEGVWLRDLASSTNVQIIPPTENRYFELAISPDGRTLYFARNQQNPEEGQQADIYRMPIFGGVPTKIVSQAQGSIGLSADGTKITFRRCPYNDDEYCSLWIADSDGKNEKRLLSRPRPIRVADSQISPDGRTIAFAAGQSRNWANEFGLAEVDIESGVEREITKEKFFNIKHLAWLPDQQGLLMTAKKYPDNTFRIWQVSTATGEIAALTNDSDNYHSLSLDSDASVLVTVKNWSDHRLIVYGMGGSASPPEVLAEASTVNFAPSGKIVFSSQMTGNHEIWTMNADGGERRQLTNHPSVDLHGVMSPDSNFVFFESNRTGEAQVWRMNADGSNQIQITHGAGGFPQLVSPDRKWLYFISSRERNLMRIPTDGGAEELILDKGKLHYALSPDASHVAYAELQGKKTVILIASLADKQTIKTFNVPNEKTGIVQSAWSADGKSLFYVWPDDRSGNYLIWQQALDGGKPIRIADLGPDELRETKAFAISPDGRSFAVIQGSWKHDAVLLRGLR